MVARSDNAEQIKTVFFMGLNIASVVSIVVMNKRIFRDYGFTFGNALMAIHYYVTAVCIFIYQRTGGFERLEQRPPVLPTVGAAGLQWNGSLLPIAIFQIGSVMFVNWSLMYNSVGLYQILKLANIPVLCVIEYFWKGITYSTMVRLSLLVLIGGIGMTTASDFSFNWIGFTHGMIATLTTAAYQISVKDLSKGMTSVQSCYYVTPITAVLFTLAVPFTDDWRRLLDYPFDTERAAVIVLSGFVAFAINLSVFVIVGRTSPLTYQVVGHVKTTLVLVSGFALFNAPADWRNICGMLLAMVGVVWYTDIKMKESAAEKARREAGKEEQGLAEFGATRGTAECRTASAGVYTTPSQRPGSQPAAH
eukprot:TRINITY_DN11218_c0_g1_i1.p1 TRINITY_DN11218_c0_g1~~TRINITY_DN11218_c0_g1_i1.p1  ORF type:complete len:406 (+),score=140.79 TRINITY_DN11218_c0_g1_i1:131-1219(+)